MTKNDKIFMARAIALAQIGMESNAGAPFGAIVVKNNKIVGEGYNTVTSTYDPTAHAEVVAIRNACKKLQSYNLERCILYTSCEPCPMCLGAIYWSRFSKVFFACHHQDTNSINFDDEIIYNEFKKNIDNRKIKFIPLMREEALKNFTKWNEKEDRIQF